MHNKLTAVILFVFSAIIPACAASHKQANSVPSEPNSFQKLINDANKGAPNSQFELGIMYYEGNSVPQDFNEAAKWFTKASEQGYAPAQYNLGVIYESDLGVQDYNEAVKWYTKAAQQGYTVAQFNLGAMFALGRGVVKDDVEAYKWILLAGMNDYDITRVEKILLAEMTPAQIDEAQKRVQEFAAKKEKAAPAAKKH
jgi:uncharacterized protein